MVWRWCPLARGKQKCSAKIVLNEKREKRVKKKKKGKEKNERVRKIEGKKKENNLEKKEGERKKREMVPAGWPRQRRSRRRALPPPWRVSAGPCLKPLLQSEQTRLSWIKSEWSSWAISAWAESLAAWERCPSTPEAGGFCAGAAES